MLREGEGSRNATPANNRGLPQSLHRGQAFRVARCTHNNRVPDVLVSDNGPKFASQEFNEFAKDSRFLLYQTSSPRYPQANGEAERAVATVKRLWSMSTDYHQCLLIYRATPLENGFTPSELLMERQIKAILPAIKPRLEVRPEIEEREEAGWRKAMDNYKARHCTRPLPELEIHVGTNVHIRDGGQEGIHVVRGMAAPRSYNVQTEQGKTVRRNGRALIPEPSQEIEAAEGRTYNSPQARLPTPRAAENGRPQRARGTPVHLQDFDTTFEE